MVGVAAGDGCMAEDTGGGVGWGGSGMGEGGGNGGGGGGRGRETIALMVTHLTRISIYHFTSKINNNSCYSDG